MLPGLKSAIIVAEASVLSLVKKFNSTNLVTSATPTGYNVVFSILFILITTQSARCQLSFIDEQLGYSRVQVAKSEKDKIVKSYFEDLGLP